VEVKARRRLRLRLRAVKGEAGHTDLAE